jgi:hypothetical protein
MLGGWRQVKDKARESPVRLLDTPPLVGVTEALRSHSRGSEKVIETYSSLALKLVREPAPPPLHPRRAKLPDVRFHDLRYPVTRSRCAPEDGPTPHGTRLNTAGPR